MYEIAGEINGPVCLSIQFSKPREPPTKGSVPRPGNFWINPCRRQSEK